MLKRSLLLLLLANGVSLVAMEPGTRQQASDIEKFQKHIEKFTEQFEKQDVEQAQNFEKYEKFREKWNQLIDQITDEDIQKLPYSKDAIIARLVNSMPGLDYVFALVYVTPRNNFSFRAEWDKINETPFGQKEKLREKVKLIDEAVKERFSKGPYYVAKLTKAPFEFPPKWIESERWIPSVSSVISYPSPSMKEKGIFYKLGYYFLLSSAFKDKANKDEFFRDFIVTMRQLPTQWPHTEQEQITVLKQVEPLLERYAKELQPGSYVATGIKTGLNEFVNLPEFTEPEKNDLLKRWFVLEKALYHLQTPRARL